MQITVHNPNNLPTMDYREWIPLQGHLKDLSKENYNKLKNVLIKRGFTVPAFLWNNPEDGKYYIMDAHQRQRVLIKENATPYELPYVLIEANSMQDAKSQLLEITSQYGTITYDGLDEFIEIAELPQAEVYEAVHYDGLPLLGENTEMPEVEEDDAPEVSTEPAVSKLGEVYQLGKHRVMCGSSTNEDDVNKLLNNQMIDLYLTDPPYNVDYVGKTKDALTIDNDSMDDGEFLAFLADAFRRADEHLKSGAAFYIFHADSEGYNFRAAVKESGWLLKQCLIWVKQTMVMGRQDYQWKHEPILYGWKSGSSHSWFSDRKQTTVLEFDRPSRSADHPTTKPIEILAYLIKNSSKAGDLVYDSFSGSGSTLIACEQTDRICYGMELDPKYVDVIRKRYWKFVNDGNEEGWQEGTGTIQREKSEDGK